MSGSHRLYTFLWYLVWPFFNLLHPTRLIGREKLPEKGGLLCANHSSDSDPIMICMAMGPRYQVHAMAKTEIFKVPGLGFIARKAGFFSVDRGKADSGAVKQAIRYLNDGEHVLMFPEGTRIKNGKDRHGNPPRAKAGAAMIVSRTGDLVVPLYIPPKKRWFRFTYVVVGDPYPIVTEDGRRPTSRDYLSMAEDIMERVYALRPER